MSPDSHPYADTGKKLAERRDELDMTQDKLANLVGIRSTTVSSIERGRNAITRSKRGDWEQALQLQPGTITRAYNEGGALQRQDASSPSRTEDAFERLDRLYEEWKSDPDRRGRLAEILEGEPPGDEAPMDRLDRAYRQWKADPGENGVVLRGLLKAWGEKDTG